MNDDLIDLQALKDNVNFYDLALFLGEKNLKVSYNSVMMCCPFHQEKTASFSYHINKKFFYCFGCHKNGNVLDYVIHKLELKNLKQAIDFLINFSGHDPSTKRTIVNGDYKKQLNTLNKYKKTRVNSFTYFTEQDIQNMVQFRPDTFEKKGFDKDVLDFFQVGFDFKKKRIVVPMRNENNELVGVTGRTLDPNYKELGLPKWLHYQGSNVSENFFNINNAISASKEMDGSIIIVEGPKDAIWLHQHGFKNVIALLSNSVTQVQKGILLKNFLTVYLFLDGDKGGDNGKSSILEKIKGYFNIYNVNIGNGKDPDDMTKEEISNAIKESTKL